MKNYKIEVTTTVYPEASNKVEFIARKIEDVMDGEIINDTDVSELSAMLIGLAELDFVGRVTVEKGKRNTTDAYRYVFFIYYKDFSARSRVVLKDAYADELNSNMMDDIVSSFNLNGINNRIGGVYDGEEVEDV